jgi:hypothetical protein
VPQTAKSTGALPHVSHAVYKSGAPPTQQQLCVPMPLSIPGTPVSMRLERSQIDKVAKDKTNKYPDNFQVTLFMFRPDDQSDAGTFSSSPSCLASTKLCGSKSSPDSSSEEETTDSEAVGAMAEHVHNRGDNNGGGLITKHATASRASSTGGAIFQSEWV